MVILGSGHWVTGETEELESVGLDCLRRFRLAYWADGFGFRDSGGKVPATANTVFRVVSISKLLTDIAVMKLVEQGNVSLDSPIREYLPNFLPKNLLGGHITLRQLMSHRSGLVREPPVGHYFDPEEPSLEMTVRSLNDTSLVYKPGTKTKYSNAAPVMDGALIGIGKRNIEHKRQSPNC